MLVGVCTVQLRLPQAANLKDKRRVIKGLKERLRSRHNVSIAEVDHQDNHQQSTLGLAIVSNETMPIHRTFNAIIRSLDVHPEAEVIYHEVEIV